MLPSDSLLVGLLAALAVGMIVGSVPLFIALKRKRDSLGYTFFSICVIASLVLGLIGAVPVGVVAVTIILLVTKGN
jgi:hypothetical protein